MKRGGFTKKGGLKKSNQPLSGKKPKSVWNSNKRSSLISLVDTKFSIHLRSREWSDDSGFCTCFTCGKRLPWRETQVGHFKSRGHLGLRWDLDNVKPQCFNCNVTLGGNLEEYAKRLGEEMVMTLELRSLEVVELSDDQIRNIIKNLK